VHDGRITYQGAVPEPEGHHAEKGHDHVHPHAALERPAICVAPTDRVTNYPSNHPGHRP
jgi:zinc transport system ATP-binding protein